MYKRFFCEPQGEQCPLTVMRCNAQVEVEYVDMAPPAGVLWPQGSLQRASLLQSKYAATSEKFTCQF